MSTHELARMRELPVLIQRTRAVGTKLSFSRELLALTERYKRERLADSPVQPANSGERGVLSAT